MNLTELIKTARPNLKANSINAYVIALKKLNNDKQIDTLDFLKNKDIIKSKIDNLKITTARNYLTSIIVILTAAQSDENLINYYKNFVNKLNGEYNEINKKQIKNVKQEANWVTSEELSAVFKQYEKKVKNLDLKNKIKIKNNDKTLLQEYLVSGLYTLLPPIRLDFSPMVIINDKKDIKPGINYLVNLGRNKKYFLIQEYKNVKFLGIAEIKIPPKLNTIINTWLKYNDTGHFLINNRGESLSANGLGKLITKVFKIGDKNITINLLRHIYVSSNVDMAAIKASEKLASDMMHSPNVQKNIYFKKD